MLKAAMDSVQHHQGKSMNTRLVLAALLVLTGAQATAAELPHTTSQRENATSLLAISPIFNQLVAFKMPLSFHIANEETSAHAYIRQAVPKGETAEQWTQMITVAGYKDVAINPGPPPAVLINTIASGFKKACPDTISVMDLGNPPIDGYPAALAFVGCGAMSRVDKTFSEAALVLVIKGSRDYYTIQWAERGPAQARPAAFDKQKWKSRLGQLLPVFLCARIAGEKSPYPSCTSRLPSDDDSLAASTNNSAI